MSMYDKNRSNTNDMSASERTALAFMSALPMKVIPKQTFSPYLPIQYRDGDGVELIGKPDALCIQALSKTHIENKNGVLSDHRSKASSHRAFQEEFNYSMESDQPKEYLFLANHFKHNNFPFLMANSWNNSLYKLLTLQKLHGWERFLVVFAKPPHARDAERYTKAGLVFCTNDTLAQMLGIIELAAHGLYFPFRLDARRSGYSITVEPSPNPAHAGLTPEQIAADNRACFEEVVAAAAAAEAEVAAARAAQIAEFVARRTVAAAAPACTEDRVLPANAPSLKRSRK